MIGRFLVGTQVSSMSGGIAGLFGVLLVVILSTIRNMQLRSLISSTSSLRVVGVRDFPR
jgi:hypothetical protein